jgi:aminopeptidase N
MRRDTRRGRAFFAAAALGLVLGPAFLGGAHPAAGAAQPVTERAAGLGDPYYPALGNAGYDAQHYTLDLAVDVGHDTISGTVTMAARATSALREVSLDFVGFHVGAVAVDGAAAASSRTARKLVIVPPRPLAAGQPFSVAVTYSGRPTTIASTVTPSGDGGWHDDGHEVYVASEPDGAKGWFPVNDHPLDKATYTFRLTVPRPYTAVANGLPASTVAHGATTTYIWEERAPMASYLATVAIARFAVRQARGPHGLPLLSYYPPSLAAAAEATFARLPQMIAYFESILGPYPFEAYGTIMTALPMPYALETQTRSLFSPAVLSYIPDRAQEGIAHELAHQWFGDSVSLRTWRDIWLNEGFATYLEWLWLEHIGARDYLTGLLQREYAYLQQAPLIATLLQHPALPGRKVLPILRTLFQPEGRPASDVEILQAMGLSSVDELTSERALGLLGARPGSANAQGYLEEARYPLPTAPPPTDLFPLTAYTRGAMTLQALRLRVGDTTFWRILRTYAARYRYGNAGTADFITVAERVSGQDLSALFHTWLYSPAVPPMPALRPTQ